MTSPVDFISGPSDDVDAGESDEGEDGLLHANNVSGMISLVKPSSVERFAGHHLRGQLGERHADGLADEWHGARGAGIDFQDVDLFLLDRELHVHQAADFEFLGHRLGGVAIVGIDTCSESENAGMTQALSPLWMPACSMCSMIAPITTVSPSAMQSTSTSVASSRKRSTSTGRSGLGLDGVAHVTAQFVFAVDDLHGAAAEDERRPHQHGIADLAWRPRRPRSSSVAVPLGGLVEAELVEHRGEMLAVLGASRCFAAVPMMWTPWLEAGGEVQRGLAAELDDDAPGFSWSQILRTSSRVSGSK